MPDQSYMCIRNRWTDPKAACYLIHQRHQFFYDRVPNFMLSFTLSVTSEKPFLWTIPAICCDLWKTFVTENNTLKEKIYILYTPLTPNSHFPKHVSGNPANQDSVCHRLKKGLGVKQERKHLFTKVPHCRPSESLHYMNHTEKKIKANKHTQIWRPLSLIIQNYTFLIEHFQNQDTIDKSKGKLLIAFNNHVVSL